MRKRVHFVHEEKLLRGTKRERARLVVKNARHIIIIISSSRKEECEENNEFFLERLREALADDDDDDENDASSRVHTTGEFFESCKRDMGNTHGRKGGGELHGGCGASENNARG